MAYEILCVDDVDTNLFVLKNLFRTKHDYNLHLANSGQEAFEILLQERIDLVLLDIMMPEMDGFEVASLLQENQLTKEIPIIFVTAKTDEKSIKEAFDKGGVDYIIKPYKAYELFARVKTHLQLATAKKRLKEREILLEHIIDQQSNLIIITDGEDIESVNLAFLKFFGVEKIEEFGRDILKLKSLFQEEHYINSENDSLEDDWVEQVYQNSETDFIVAIPKRESSELVAFILKVSKLAEERLYIITMTDITHTAVTTVALKQKAFHDSLTGIFNREKLNEFLEYEIEVATRYKTPLSTVIFDIDHFKRVNDTYGHLVGDYVLKEMTSLVQNFIRHTDLLARWGGEEFIIVSPSTPIESAEVMAENLRKLIEEEEFSQVGHITCSFGVSSFEESDSVKSIIQRADEQLYRAKESGRNRVCVEQK